MPLSRLTGNSFNATANTNIDNGLLFLNPTTNRVGVNVTNPGYPLDIATDAASQTVRFRGRAVDNTTRIDFFNNGANTAFGGIYSFSNELGFEASQAGGAIAFRSGGTSDRVRITSAGVLDVLTGQIKFPASQNASSDPNTLDDYEEGTWTPIIETESGSDYTLTSHTCRYTKIGNTVTVNATIAYSAVGSGTISIVTLPFTPAQSPMALAFAGTITGASNVNNITEVTLIPYTINKILIRVSAVDTNYWTAKNNWRSQGSLTFNGTFIV